MVCSPGSLRVLTNMSSSDIKAKQGDLINLLCSAQSESSVTFNWEKDQKPLESFMEKEQPHRSSLLVVKVKDEESFGKYVCHIRDQFETTVLAISVQTIEHTSCNSGKQLVAITILTILLIISLFALVYFIWQNRRNKSSNILANLNRSIPIHLDTDSTNNENHYEQMEVHDQQSSSAENDDNLHTHLIKVS